jgi:hypothetical protein
LFFYWPNRPVAGIDAARDAIEFIVNQSVHPERVEGLAHQSPHPTIAPAAYHRAFASEIFLKTHAIKITTIQPSPRAPSKKFLIQTPNGLRLLPLLAFNTKTLFHAQEKA